ncbi:hypothetical protein [Nocardia sp. NPDC006630]|uniref:hypothetical protein n=1 Tax=Nocardia sp. NPDC006630 TaxID=3157181 RepID=UPI0033A85902
MRTRLGVVMFTGAMLLAPALTIVPASATPANPTTGSSEVAGSGSSGLPLQIYCFLKDLRATLSAESGSNCISLTPN